MTVRLTAAATVGDKKVQRCIYQNVESDQDITELLWAARQFLRSQLKKANAQPLEDNLGLEIGGEDVEIELNEEASDNGEIK